MAGAAPTTSTGRSRGSEATLGQEKASTMIVTSRASARPSTPLRAHGVGAGRCGERGGLGPFAASGGADDERREVAGACAVRASSSEEECGRSEGDMGTRFTKN